MKNQILSLALATSLALALALPCPAATVYSTEQLQQDWQALQAGIAQTHPDTRITADPEQLRQAMAETEARLQRGPMTREQAWLTLSRLNPVLNDAHFFVNMPQRKEMTRAHLKAGGRLFPFELQTDARGESIIRAALGGTRSKLAGARILSINGQPIQEVAQALLAHMHGDTPDFRANVLSTRWYWPYWQVFGAPERFRLQILQGGAKRSITVAGSNALPQLLQDERFETLYALELLPDQAALLTVKSFGGDHLARFRDFAQNAFAQVRAAGTQTLIIDVRANGGGDDVMWKEVLLRYLADQPFRIGSDYLKKVIPGRASGSEHVGDVVQGQVESWVQPISEEPLHFAGQVYVLIGRFTYSSAVLFSNVVQDFGFGKLVGEAGVVRSRQTGGIQSIALPHTGLELVVPRFVLTRPSGRREPVLLQPDVLLPDSALDERALVRALLSHIKAARQVNSSAD